MNKPTVIVTETLDPQPADWLAQRVNLIWRMHDQPDFSSLLEQADGLVVRTYTQVNDSLLQQAPRLKVVGRAGVGLDNVDVAACRRRGVQVVYTPDANTQAVVEYVVGLMLDALRPRTDMPPHVSAKGFHELRKTQVGVQLDELTLGILGFGRIGKRLGQVAHAIGMKVLVNDLIPESELRPLVQYPFEWVDKAALYSRSDILTIHTDGRSENRELINAQALAQLKPGCLFINAARGMLVDNQALATWAKQNAGSGVSGGGKVILDVHEPEPPTETYPLYDLPNVRLLPHLASRTDRAMMNMSWVVRDVLAALEGKPVQYPAP